MGKLRSEKLAVLIVFHFTFVCKSRSHFGEFCGVLGTARK